MKWKLIFATGAFGGIAPVLLQLAIDLTQRRKTVEAVGVSIFVGMAIYALLGGGLSLVWQETDLKKVFYIGLGLPSLLTIATANVTAPQPPSNPIPNSTIVAPQQGLKTKSSDRPDTSRLVPEFDFASNVYAQVNIPARTLIIDLISQSVPSDIIGSPLYIIFEPTGSNASIQYGQAIVEVPPTATSFRVEGSLASSDSISLPGSVGATTRVRLGAEKKSWYGLFYSLGIKSAPYQLIAKTLENTNPTTSPDDAIGAQIELSATSRPVTAPGQGKARYAFSLAIKVPETLKDQIAKVEYDLEYNANPIWLTSEDTRTNFMATYEGWGCYSNVDITVVFKNPETQPRKKHFDMCSVLNW